MKYLYLYDPIYFFQRLFSYLQIDFRFYLGGGIIALFLSYCICKVNRCLRKQYKYIFLLSYYIMITLAVTVFSRIKNNGYSILYDLPHFELLLTKSKGASFLLREYLFNVIMFVPFGILLRLSFGKKTLKVCVCYAFLFSLLIESLQLVLQRGNFEISDLLFNTIGSVVGNGIYKIGGLWTIYKKCRQK